MIKILNICNADKGYSERNLRNMKRFAKEYPDFPFLQVPLAEIQERPIWQVPLVKLAEEGKDFVQIPLTQITSYLCTTYKQENRQRFSQ